MGEQRRTAAGVVYEVLQLKGNGYNGGSWFGNRLVVEMLVFTLPLLVLAAEEVLRSSAAARKAFCLTWRLRRRDPLLRRVQRLVLARDRRRVLAVVPVVTCARELRRPGAARSRHSSCGERTDRPGPPPTARGPQPGRAARIGSNGAARPVMSSTCRAAWCSSISPPRHDDAPAAGRQRRRPGVVDDVEQHRDVRPRTARSGSAAPDGSVDTSEVHAVQQRRAPRARTTPTAPAGQRTARVAVRRRPHDDDGVRAPQQRQRGEGRTGPSLPRPAPRPAPRTTPRRRRAPRRSRATSVLSPCRPSVAHQHRVGGGDRGGQAASPTSSSGSTASLSGMVSDSPAQDGVEPGHEGRQARGGDLDGVVGPVEAERGVGRPVQQRRQGVADRAAEDGGAHG